MIEKQTEIKNWMTHWTANELGVSPSNIDATDSFDDLGFSSIQAIGVVGDLEEWLQLTIDPTIAWEYPTIETLSKYLAQQIQFKQVA